MRRIVQTVIVTAAWLLTSPTLHFNEADWLEAGYPAAVAEAAQQPKTVQKQKGVRRARSSAPIPSSVAPGLYPMQQYAPPEMPNVTGTVVAAPPVAGYPQVPTVPILPRGSTAGAGVETSQDRVVRCTHQGALGGLPSNEQGAYIQSCAFQ